MPIPTEITFHDMATSAAAEAAIHRWITRLEQAFDRILACQIVVDRPHRRHRPGSPFQIHLIVSVPGAEIVCNHVQHVEVYVAIADAFRAARRRLRDRLEPRRAFVRGPLFDSHASNR